MVKTPQPLGSDKTVKLLQLNMKVVGFSLVSKERIANQQQVFIKLMHISLVVVPVSLTVRFLMLFFGCPVARFQLGKVIVPLKKSCGHFSYLRHLA